MTSRPPRGLILAAALSLSLAVLAVAWHGAWPHTRPQPGPARPSTNTTPALDQAQKLAEIKARIAGREQEPAEQVFKNIEVLKGKPAGRLPGMMAALTGLLGVDCAHCHVVDRWELEDKPAKQVARQHFAMQARLLAEQFGGENRVTCWTCHRGQPKPEVLPK